LQRLLVDNSASAYYGAFRRNSAQFAHLAQFAHFGAKGRISAQFSAFRRISAQFGAKGRNSAHF
jgi:hypothetical protein